MRSTKPLLFFATRHSTLYNITPSMLSCQPLGIQLSASDFQHKRHVLEALPSGWDFKQFCGYGSSFKTYLTPYDLFSDKIKDCNDRNIVKIQCDNGYVQFDAAAYNQLADIIAPDYLVCLTDSPHQQGLPAQRRALAKTLNYVRRLKEKTSSWKSKLLVPLHVCQDFRLTMELIQACLEISGIGGFLLCNLCRGEEINARQQAYRLVVEALGSRAQSYELGLAGAGKIADIKHALEHGITLFEVSFPFVLAERHIALVKDGQQFAQKTPQLKHELSPLSRECSCYACQRHSQAYIAHLIACKEPNAKILLSIHNTQAYFDFYHH